MYNNTLEQVYNYESFLSPLVSVLIIFFCVGLMLYLYRYADYWLAILCVWLFSVIFGLASIQNFWLPFSPYIQIFFILIQTIYFFQSSLLLYRYGKGKGK